MHRHLLANPALPSLETTAPAIASPWRHRVTSPVLFRPKNRPHTEPWWPIDTAPPFPGQPRRRPRRNSGQHAANPPQGLHCKVPDTSRGLCANRGYGCEPSDLSRVPTVNRFLKLLPFSTLTWKINIKSQKICKNAKNNFVVFLVSWHTSFAKHVYTFEL
jgi:hypothetical protein